MWFSCGREENTVKQSTLLNGLNLEELARDFVEEENSANAGMGALGRSPQDARAALQQFVDDYMNGRRTDWANQAVVVTLIERVLEVDMAISGNRKGGIPKALGL